MEFDKLPSRPVVKSTVSAQAEWERWLYENHFQRLMDGDGLDWTLDLDVQLVPDESIHTTARYTATIQLGADADVETLLKTGTLDPDGDARTIGLVGDRKVPLRMKPMVHEAVGENEAREMLARVLPELRETIANSKLRDIKRALIGRWIDAQGVFGAREEMQPW